ncbi:hypothetical protein BLNAU_6121 [Blattamonas nauphoetae]|uniref:MMS19 nucleotide excision repair protein n=1 Tax=Blattamonas nauphoetae TaxID=2049346 RepID=A0ABQ9Y539_9EUKA|nr:hypothetical protein BLNAU_6121 [Blattamonas nauphoetae]
MTEITPQDPEIHSFFTAISQTTAPLSYNTSVTLVKTVLIPSISDTEPPSRSLLQCFSLLLQNCATPFIDAMVPFLVSSPSLTIGSPHSECLLYISKQKYSQNSMQACLDFITAPSIATGEDVRLDSINNILAHAVPFPQTSYTRLLNYLQTTQSNSSRLNSSLFTLVMKHAPNIPTSVFPQLQNLLLSSTAHSSKIALRRLEQLQK